MKFLAMSFDQLLNPAVLIFLVGGLVAIVAIVGYYLHDYAKGRAENELKQTMLGQGKSAEEIERVLRAGKKLSPEEEKANRKTGT